LLDHHPHYKTVLAMAELLARRNALSLSAATSAGVSWCCVAAVPVVAASFMVQGLQ
jgi:hypothetical protein